jgi:hypothetical protein
MRPAWLGTHERLKTHLRQLVDPKIKQHQGRIVKNTGDGMLVEFPSVVDAMRCAAEVQRGMIDREPDVTAERRIKFRMGINLGDGFELTVPQRSSSNRGLRVLRRSRTSPATFVVTTARVRGREV